VKHSVGDRQVLAADVVPGDQIFGRGGGMMLVEDVKTLDQKVRVLTEFGGFTVPHDHPFTVAAAAAGLIIYDSAEAENRGLVGLAWHDGTADIFTAPRSVLELAFAQTIHSGYVEQRPVRIRRSVAAEAAAIVTEAEALIGSVHCLSTNRVGNCSPSRQV
jgi:hypothetical protein